MAIITLSRMPGTRGDALAQALAQRLGYRLVGRAELMRLAEEELGAAGPRGRSPALRERGPSFWERVTGERHRYLHLRVLRSAALSVAEQDDVVLVGLGAGRLLRGLPQTLALLVVAPAEFRLEQLMLNGYEEVPGPLSREQARDLMRRRDQDNARYMRYLFDIDWLESHHWDLVLNAARFDAPEAVELIVAAVERGLAPATAADRQRLADLALASRVEAALLKQVGVVPECLKVWADDGRVRLEGQVVAEADRLAVEEAVRAIPGVRDVESDLLIHSPPAPFGA